jgi:hypothetical protein
MLRSSFFEGGFMRAGSIAAVGLALSLGVSIGEAAPVTKPQLMSMAKEGVDPKVIRAIVERDCVDFEVDAGNAAELSRALPPEVLEAAISCRRRSSPESLAAPPASELALPATGPGTLHVRAEFIGESGALSCACLLDGQPLVTLTKPAQGEFGQAVERTRVREESADLPVPSGKHRLVFRCDPKAQEVAVEIETKAGQHRTVEIRETTLRHWKLRKVE